MKIIVALDSFKGGLSAEQACQAVAEGLREVNPRAEIVLKPMADGGEGTAASLLASRPSGQWVPVVVAGPLPRRRVEAGFVWFSDDHTAVVEMAVASGLPLLADHERNPMLTSTYGTGELVKAAVEYGARRILLAIGGSATVDGGVGAAVALGWRFLDEHDQPIPPVGGSLSRIIRIIPPDGLSLPPITVLCDVINTLCGERGAAAVFGPQKGADEAMVEQLESGLFNLANRVRERLGIDMLKLSGGGAAGGLGAGAAAFFNAELAPGIATIVKAARLGEALDGADWCVTGEGSFDDQSLDGKVVSGVAEAARARGVPVVVFAGRVKADPEKCRRHGIHEARATHSPRMPMEEVMRREAELISNTAADWLRERTAE